MSIRAEASFSANSVESVRAASKLGLGLAMLTYWDVRTALAEASLVLVELEDGVPEQLSIAAVLPTRHYVPNRVRVLLEHLEQALKSG